jgi:hypothetical protein
MTGHDNLKFSFEIREQRQQVALLKKNNRPSLATHHCPQESRCRSGFTPRYEHTDPEQLYFRRANLPERRYAAI